MGSLQRARSAARTAVVAFAATLVVAPSRAATVQFDMTPLLDADVVLNDGTGTLDPTQVPIDLGAGATGNFVFPTQSAAVRLAGGFTPDGLPDDGHFAATPSHPEVQLWWDNGNDGDNCRRIASATGSFTLDVPAQRYQEVHLFATSGDGDSQITVTLVYDDFSSTATNVTVGDWFDDPPATATYYRLVDGRDRVQPGSGPGVPFTYEDSNDPAIHGFAFAADPGKLLAQIRVERTDTTGALDFFGGVGVTPPAGPDLYESQIPAGLLAPANIVARGVASPTYWPAPRAPVLYYFVDDGAGTPALVYVSKLGAGIVFTF